MNKSKRIISFFIMFICLIGLIVLGTNKVNAEEEIYEIKVGEGYYETLPEAIAEANSSEKEKILITLLKDISLGEKITITKDITISGDYTIIRARDLPETTDKNELYKGTLFTVNKEAKLTLDGGITIDGGSDHVFDEAEFMQRLDDILAFWKINPGVKPDADIFPSFNHFISYTTPASTAQLIVVNGTFNVNNATIQNNYGSTTILLNSNSIASLNDGSLVTNNAFNSNGSAIRMSAKATLNIEEGAEVSYNYGGSNGGCIYNYGGTIIMDGGYIHNNYGVNCNGTAIMLHTNQATIIMNGGEISHNVGLPGNQNGNCCAIYVHSTGIMEMNGGSVNNNIGMKNGGIMVLNSTGKLTINGGTVSDNKFMDEYYTENANYELYKASQDVLNYGTTKITGGTFTQDVSNFISDEYKTIETEPETYVVLPKTSSLVIFDYLNGEKENVIVYTDEKVTAPTTVPVNGNYIFKGWNFDFNTPITDTTVIEAIWDEDINNNNIADSDETGTIVLTQIGEGKVVLKPVGKATLVNKENNVYTYVYDSTDNKNKEIYVFVHLEDKDPTDGDVDYIISAPYTVKIGEELTVEIGRHEIVAKDGTVKISGYYESIKDERIFETLKEDTLKATGITENFSNYTVKYVTELGVINLDNFGYNDGRKEDFFNIITVPQKGIEVIIIDNVSGLSKTITINLEDEHYYLYDCDTTCEYCDYVREAIEHTYDNDCDTTCNICNTQREVKDHVYDNDCDTTCNICGTEREVKGHVYDNDCDTTCNICSTEREVKDHVYDNDCDTTCNICNTEREVKDHVYDNDCDTTCNVCNTEREVKGHVYDNDCDATCNVCNTEREVTGHVYDNDCDTTCNVCNTEREVKDHVYDNDCDSTCNVCNTQREVKDHVYDNDCDTTCNNCGTEREVKGHVYDNDCDTTCEYCDYVREAIEHTYDNDCDTTCNICNTQREVKGHVYDNDCDTTCNICNTEREVKDHVYDNDCDTTCNICNTEREVKDHVYDNDKDSTCNNCGTEREVEERKCKLWWLWLLLLLLLILICVYIIRRYIKKQQEKEQNN